jgi:non-specific protein-tyrosine kinase
MELLQYWGIIRKRLWLIILPMMLAGSVAAYFVSQQVPHYQSSTTLFINPRQISPLLPGGAEGFSIATGNDSVAVLANTYSTLIDTRSFVEQVADEISQPVTPAEVADALSSRHIVDTQFYRISATHPDPATAQEIANTAAQVLIASEIERQQDEQEQVAASQGPVREQQEIQELMTLLQAELSYYNDRIREVQDQIRQVQASDQTADGAAMDELPELIESLENLRYARIDVQTRLTNAERDLAALTNANADPVVTAVVVDEAILPDEPLPSQAVQRIVLALLVGATLGGGLAFLLEYLDYTIKTPEALEQLYSLPVLGVIGETSRKHWRRQSSHLVMLSSSAPVAESFRALRTGVQVEVMNTGLRSILITSAGPGEGKTFVAANLAASLAQSGRKVILVDTDLRKPRLHQAFNLERGVGFTNLVVNQQETLEAALQETPIRNLRVLTCGVVPPNPSELLHSWRTLHLMDQIKEHADVVIYDSPPAATVTDASVLASHVDGVIQVIWAGETRINLVLRCKAVLEQVGANILGPVLNQVTVSDLGYSYYYYYYGNYEQTNGSSRRWWQRLVPGQRKKYKKQQTIDPDAYYQAVESPNGTRAPGGGPHDDSVAARDDADTQN